MAGFSNIKDDESIMFADNASFDGTERGGKLTTNGQLWVGATASPHVKVGNITSPLGTLSIGYSSPNITVDLAGGSVGIDSIAVQATTAPGVSPVVPTAAGLITVNGAVVANHSVVLESRSRAANAYNLEVQYAASAAATDGTKSGVSHFNSSQFTVDASGFVSVTSGTFVTSITGGPGITITGTAAVPIVNSVIFTDTTATTLAVDNGYFATAAGTYNMPASAAQGEVIEIVCDTSGAVVLDCPANNFIRIGSLITSSGGTATSTQQGDALKLRYRSSSLTWEAISVIGTWLMA